MFPYELLDLSTVISSRIDTHWTLFISVHLALIGGIIYIDKPLKNIEKVFAVLIYTGFAVANYIAMSQQAQLLDAVYNDIYQFKDLECCINSSTVQHVATLVDSGFGNGSIIFVRIVHLAMFAVMVVSILYDKAAQLGKE